VTDDELTLRAGLAAFSDSDRVVPVRLDNFDPLNSTDDCLRLLIRTNISFSRLSDTEIAAETGDSSHVCEISEGDELAAARRAACGLAASWIEDSDVTAYRVATGRFTRNK
jgi:hypothetical protein